MRHAIDHNDVLAALRDLPDNAFDGLLCDPPYGLSFMGKRWDYDVPSVAVWAEALRVLKPGAALLAFGGTRTYHRMAVNIEDAGFELRDSLAWMYGSGFPKSLDVKKAITKANDADWMLAEAFDGYGTALKPAWEPCILARKPLDGTVAANVAKWGCGALAIDACRIEASAADVAAARVPQPTFGTKDPIAYNMATGVGRNGETFDMSKGRWPANVLLDEEAAAVLDAQTGVLHSHGGGTSARNKLGYGGSKAEGSVSIPRGDSGGASRFFYTAKVSTREREHGCDALPARTAAEMTGSAEDGARLESPRTGAGRGGGAKNHHPTLKPLSLTQYLARLILPPGPDATLLVPYSGAGSEMIGALLAGWPTVFGIEGEADYVAIAEARIAAHVYAQEKAA